MKFYRYEAVEYATLGMDGDYVSPRYPDPRLQIHEYNLHKETDKGYWIGYGELVPRRLKSHSKWVSKTSRKRFAYPTKEEAIQNYVARTKRRVKILKWQLLTSEMGLQLGIKLQEELKQTI